MTGFGAPRDVKGKHLKRIWELEFPEEAEQYERPINQAPQHFQPIQQQLKQQPQSPQKQNVPPPIKSPPSFH